MIIVGDEIVKSDALQEAAQLAETLGLSGLSVVDALWRAFPVRKPVLHGRAVAHPEAGRARCSSPYDLMIALGGDPLADVGLQRGRSAAGRAVDRAGRPGRLGSRQELRRRDRAEGRREGNPARAGAGAEGGRRRARSRRAPGRALAALASKNWTARRKPLVEQISKPPTRSPIDPDWLALQVVEAMPDNAILVDEGLTSSRQMHRAAPASRPLRLSRAGLGRHRLGIAGLRRRQPRQSGPAGGVLLRRRQRDVFDPVAVDRGATTSCR